MNQNILGETDHCRHRLLKYCRGQGLDLGCGMTKIKPDAIGIDLHSPIADMHKDVRKLDYYPDNFFDYVYSSHLLEEIEDTKSTIKEWLRVIKDGGYLVLYQADKDLYYPIGDPRCNPRHKHHFDWESLWDIIKGIGGVELVHHARYPDKPYREWSFELVVRKGTKENTELNQEGISILVPTLNRPKNMEKFAVSVDSTAKNHTLVEIIFGIHEEDTISKIKADELSHKLKVKIRAEIISRYFDNKVHLSYLWNQLYKRISYPIIGFFGDDVIFKTPSWDEEVRNEFAKDKAILVACNDIHVQKGKSATLFFTHKLVHDKIGFYMPTKFRRWYMDTFWDIVFREAGKIRYREDIVTEHLHPTIFPERSDAVYKNMEHFERYDRITWNSQETRSEMINCIKILKDFNTEQALKTKSVRIIQVGRIGDIIIVLPIAKHLSDQGFEVHWPVCSEYFSMFTRVPYVKAYDIGSAKDIINRYREIKNSTSDSSDLDLSIGFQNAALDTEWRSSGMRFDEWKYYKANLPISKKFKLEINRDIKKEEELYKLVVKGKPYNVTHSIGTTGRYDFGVNAIEVREIQGFCVFDWIKVLEEAEEIWCVDSCIANLINQLGIAKGRRHFKSLGPQHVTPVLDEGWDIL